MRSYLLARVDDHTKQLRLATNSDMNGFLGSRPLRVVVCDDHALMRSALRTLLTEEEGLECVGEASSVETLLPLVASERPDLVVLDLHLPGVDGLRGLEELRKRHPSVKTVVLSAADDTATIAAALRRGAAGYVLKSINPLDLPAAIRQSVESCVFHAATLESDRVGTAAPAGLSAKEAGVLTELADGKSNRQIAATLCVSEQTVKFHLRNVYRKLGVANRTDAVRFALHHDGVPAG